MGVRRLLAGGLLALGMAATAPVLAGQPVTWLVGNTLGSNGQRSGSIDTMLAYLAERWPAPGLKSTVLHANAKRSWQLIAAGQPVCHTSALRTPERERLAHFSSTQMTPPAQLITRRALLSRLPMTAAGEVNLTQLLERSSLRGALIESRSYGAEIDRLVARRPAGSKALVFYSAADFGRKILPMLARSRADFSIEYQRALQVMTAGDPTLSELVSLPIQGVNEPVVLGFACPRTPWGLATVKTIDGLLSTPEGAALLLKLAGMSDGAVAAFGSHGPQIEAFYSQRSRPEYETPALR